MVLGQRNVLTKRKRPSFIEGLFLFQSISPAVRRINSVRLSLCVRALSAARLRRISPHFVHLWMMTNSCLASGSERMGFICPPQVLARSPGRLSTCKDHKQKGQWLRELLPIGSTSRPQWAHTKESSFLVNRFCSTKILLIFRNSTRRACLRP